MTKPLIIYVTGTPGSGKTTLAREISLKLHIPHLNSDLITSGVSLSIGGQEDRARELTKTVIPILQFFAQKNVSCVFDQLLQKSPEPEAVLDELSLFAKIIFIHTLAQDPISRYLNRELSRTDRSVSRKNLTEEKIRERATHHRENLAQTELPADYENPVLVVKTDGEYSPGLDEICDFIEKNYKNKEAK